MLKWEKDQKFTQSMAAAFFDLSPSAFREKENRGHFIGIANKNIPEQRMRTQNGGYQHRKYSLNDLRQIAYALRENGKINDRQLKLIIMRIDSFAEPLLTNKRSRYYKSIGN
jgi:hypothetical protein